MDIDLNKTKKEIIIFLAATFSITYCMGLLMFSVYMHIDKIDASSFGLVQMLYPALVVILMTIYFENHNIHKKLMEFFKAYIVFSVLSIIILVSSVFTQGRYLSNITTVLTILNSLFCIYFLILILMNSHNCFAKINMIFKKNLKSTILLCLAFIGLKFVIVVLNGLFDGNLTQMIEKNIQGFVILPLSVPLGIILSFILFFGEELGWRGFLQKRLQVLFGKRFGVIILGVIWGIWHLPLCFMLYSPATPVYCLIYYVFYCTLIGIFLGFVYMKTENLWSVIMIHLINNSLYQDFNSAYGVIFTPKGILLSAAICSVVFVPFIFTKEYSRRIYEKNCERIIG